MFFSTLLIALCVAAPSSPQDIVFPEYVFTPPSALEFKTTILDGTPVYIAEDKELPLINISITFRGGDYLDDAGLTGLSEMMATLLRSGGTESMSAEELDEQFAFLAANASVRGSGTTVTANLNSLSSNFKESFVLFLEMLQQPRFQESRIALEKDGATESMKQRNDFPSGILKRENSAILFGDSYMGRDITQDSIASISVEDLHESHKKIINPSNMIIAISGDFNKDEMLAFLSDSLQGWASGSKSANPPSVESTYAPGIYYVDQDVPQGGVRISTRTFRRGDPDDEAAAVMNYILGGGGFSSRITQKVRSDEGLAYSVGSRFSSGVWGDGVWAAGFESKNPTVALAAKLIFDEVERIKTEPVSDADLALAKSALIEQFPSAFQSKAGTLAVFVSDELGNRDSGYWETYRDKIRAVTKEDVMRVANRILIPEEMAVVIVGDWGVIRGGDGDARATIEDIQKTVGGTLVELPLRDPLTLEVVGE
ncbi:MAG: insulinase family protein [Planctomycetes bacterium]|nr:insulinase family protein [Planctomycetota bacterium]